MLVQKKNRITGNLFSTQIYDLINELLSFHCQNRTHNHKQQYGGFIIKHNK